MDSLIPVGRADNRLIRAGCLAGFDEIVRSAGGSPDSVVKLAGLTPDRIASPDNLISLVSYSKVLDAAAVECRKGDFGLSFGSIFDMRNLGAIGYQFLYARTWGEALTTFCKNFAVVQDASQMELCISDGQGSLRYELFGLKAERRVQDAEFSIMLLYKTLSKLSPVFRARRIDFQHGFMTRRSKVGFGTVEVRGQRPINALHFDAAWLDTPPPHPEIYTHRLIVQDLHREMASRLERADLISAVRSDVLKRFRLGDFQGCSAAKVAADIGLSERTMHRRLESHGTCFRDLRADSLATMASEYLLNTRLTISEIGFRLGYSESSAFSRAFKTQTGSSPRQFRTAMGVR